LTETDSEKKEQPISEKAAVLQVLISILIGVLVFSFVIFIFWSKLTDGDSGETSRLGGSEETSKMVESQQRFLSAVDKIVGEYREIHSQGYNDIKKKAELARTDTASINLIGSIVEFDYNVEDWVGVITQISTNRSELAFEVKGERYAGLDIVTDRKIRFQTYRNDIVFPSSYIESIKAFASLMEFKEGERVSFSGTFIPSYRSHIMGKYLNPVGSEYYGNGSRIGQVPFYFCFSKIRTLDRKNNISLNTGFCDEIDFVREAEIFAERTLQVPYRIRGYWYKHNCIDRALFDFKFGNSVALANSILGNFGVSEYQASYSLVKNVYFVDFVDPTSKKTKRMAISVAPENKSAEFILGNGDQEQLVRCDRAIPK